MCYKKPGPRCSAHAKKILDAARINGGGNLFNALDDYDETPAGQKELSSLISAMSLTGKKDETMELQARYDAAVKRRRIKIDLVTNRLGIDPHNSEDNHQSIESNYFSQRVQYIEDLETGKEKDRDSVETLNWRKAENRRTDDLIERIKGSIEHTSHVNDTQYGGNNPGLNQKTDAMGLYLKNLVEARDRGSFSFYQYTNFLDYEVSRSKKGTRKGLEIVLNHIREIQGR